jgi:hypothetical protein
MRLRSRSALTLASLAGLAASAHAAVFTFTPLCDNTWATVCTLPPGSCGGGGSLSRNNWAQTACNATPAFPGSADDVIVGSNSLLNANPSVRSVTINAGVSFAFQGNMTTSAGFTNNGTVSTSGAGNLNYAGPFSNSAGATWIENSNTRFLGGMSFANAGTLELQSITLSANGGTNGYTNTGTIRKATAGTASMNVPLINNGAIDVQAGPFNLSGTTYNGSATSGINVAGANGAAFNLSGYTLVGRINGTGPGEINSGNVTASGATIFNVASNLRLSGDLNANAIANSSFTNNNRLTTSGAGNLNYSGSITNSASGIWVENSNTRFITNSAFTNAGVLELQSISLNSNGGANSITNSGTIRKTGPATAAINGLPVSNSGLIDVQAGTLDITGLAYTGVGSGSVSVASGAACNFNTISIGGTINFTGAGTLTSTGSLSVIGNASLNTTSAFRLFSNVTVGAGNSLTNRGLLSTSGGGNLNYVGALTNGATGTWIENSNSRFFANSSFVNNGIWELQAITLVANGGTNSLVNNATLRKVGPGSSTANIPFTNNAAINVQAGTLDFNNTTYTAVPAANIDVSTGASLNLNSMTLAGTVNCTGLGNFATTGTLTVSGNVITTTTSPLRILSNVTVTAGNSLTNQGLISTSGGGNLNYGGPLVNGNNGTWIENSNTRFFANSSFVNNGTWELQSISLASNGGTNTLTNNATVRKTGSGTAGTDIRFTNNGPVNVLDGALNFSSTTYTGNGAAAFNISSTGSVNFASMTLAGTLRSTGTGTISSTGSIVPSGNATINAVQPFALLGSISAGGAGNSLTNAGNLSTIGAGNLNYVGTIINGPTGTWVEDGNTRFFANAILTNQGTLDVRSVNLAGNGGVNAINNSGTMRKTVAATTFSTNFNFTNTGLVDVQEGTASFTGTYTQAVANARTVIRQGATLSGGARTYADGRLEGRGTHNGNVALVAATIAPGELVALGSGALNITGTLNMQINSRVELDIAAPSNPTSERVIVSGAAAVAGVVVVNVPSGYNPPLGEVYEVVRSNNSQRTGTFSNVTVNADPGIGFALSYTPSSVLLTVTATNCDDIDFNNNDVYPEDQDVVDFFNVLAGGTPTTCQAVVGCNDVDFNNNNVFPEDQDVIDFFNVLAGGGCP